MAEPSPATEKRERQRRVRELEVVVARVRRETADTISLFLAADEPFEYEAGHFCTIDPHQFSVLQPFIAHLEDLKGHPEKPRAYSLGSAPHEEHVVVTVKEERYVSGETPYPPVLSPLLVNHTPVGARLIISGFTGAYTIPHDAASRINQVVHVCAGSGIVPSLGLIKASLHRNEPFRHTLLYSSKTRQDIIYYQDFEDLHRQHPDRFEVIHCLTREEPAGLRGARRGRITKELLQEVIVDPASTLAFTCGPGITPYERKAAREKGEEPTPRFVEHMVAALHEVGLERKQVKQESWG